MSRSRVYQRFVAVSAVLSMLVVVFVTGYVLGGRGPVAAQGHQPPEAEELFDPFWQTWTLLHQNYVNPLDDHALMEGALRGMLATLGDPNTDYMDPETYARINQAMSGEYEGIGATVGKDEITGGLELISIMQGSPAEKAGLRANDIIIEVDGDDITDLSQDEIIALVRGPDGTTVRLGIRRAGEEDLLQIEVTRERIMVPSVSYEVLEGEIGYIRLSQFDFDSSPRLREALETMDANNLKGLILDMRGDPGGYLATAIDVASAFLPDGPIVLERTPNQETVHQALGNALAPDVPMVVLVDQGSASASELVAGALQDRGRATIVGMPTFGKGSVQTWHELSNGGAVRITISLWFTPDGHSVNEVGIEPDVQVAYEPDTATGEDNQLETAIRVLTEGMDSPEQAPEAALPTEEGGSAVE